MYLQKSQREVVDGLGLDQPALWPDAPNLEDHFCVYRVLARLAREEFFNEAISFNYDCGFEAGLHDEGFMFSPRTMAGRRWHDHATVISDASTNARLQRRGAFGLIKAHGCAARYRESLSIGTPPAPEESIVLRWSQLLDWRTDSWARDVFSERARRNVLLLIGFSGQDPVIHIGLTRILEDVYRDQHVATPRVVAIDFDPDTIHLQMLIREGCNGAVPAGAVTHVSTRPASTTAVGLVLLTELLALRLDAAFRVHGFVLPRDLKSRLSALVVTAPAMLRWSYLLRRPDPWRDYAQRINLEQAARHGYVPLMAAPRTTALALQSRERLLASLRMPPDEIGPVAADNHGFVVQPGLGRAFLPVGLTRDELRHLTNSAGGQLDQARRILDRPPGLDGVLASVTSGWGVSIETGEEVSVP
jgi:hypothetical protein